MNVISPIVDKLYAIDETYSERVGSDVLIRYRDQVVTQYLMEDITSTISDIYSLSRDPLTVKALHAYLEEQDFNPHLFKISENEYIEHSYDPFNKIETVVDGVVTNTFIINQLISDFTSIDIVEVRSIILEDTYELSASIIAIIQELEKIDADRFNFDLISDTNVSDEVFLSKLYPEDIPNYTDELTTGDLIEVEIQFNNSGDVGTDVHMLEFNQINYSSEIFECVFRENDYIKITPKSTDLEEYFISNIRVHKNIN